jgi:phosphatidylserine synthase
MLSGMNPYVPLVLSGVSISLGLMAVAVAWRNRWRKAVLFGLAACASSGLTYVGWVWVSQLNQN